MSEPQYCPSWQTTCALALTYRYINRKKEKRLPVQQDTLDSRQIISVNSYENDTFVLVRSGRQGDWANNT